MPSDIEVCRVRRLRAFSCSVSKTINAPLPFVYSWCTDFREDDDKITGAKSRISILQRTKTRFIISVKYKNDGKTMSAAKIVSLMPPNAWHLDWIGDEHNETGDYRLTGLGNRGTRLNITFRVQNKAPTAPGRVEWSRHANAVWDEYVAALERDYNER
jgi:hypothetical protein